MPPQTPRFIDRPFVPASLVLGLALLLSAGFISYTVFSVRALDDTLTATGSAKELVKADSAKWNIQLTRMTLEGSIPSAYAAVESDKKQAVSYLKEGGVEESSISFSSISVNQEYTSDSNAPRRYSVSMTITVQSNDVERVQKLAQNMGALIAKGVIVNPGMPEYYVGNLASIRISLLGEAVKDARARADELAKAGGVSVGKIKSSSSGVVQVLSPNSIDVSDYGSYDTSTIEKQVMVTVRATFSVR